MASPIRTMLIVRYSEGTRASETEVVHDPSWESVEAAVRALDDNLRPIVILSRQRADSSEKGFEDADALNVVGGGGRHALFQMMGDWEFAHPWGGDEEVRLWQSDQGYFCRQKNILTDVAEVLRYVRVFYDTASYAELERLAESQ